MHPRRRQRGRDLLKRSNARSAAVPATAALASLAGLTALTAFMAAPLASAAVAGAAPRLASGAAGQRPAATAPGTLRSWGFNDAGQLGNGNTQSRDHPVTVRLPKGAKVTSVRGGDDFALAATSTGAVLAWGLNYAGELGDGSFTSSLTPVKVRLPAGTKVTAVRAGDAFGLALTSSGRVLAWGANTSGQLGNGSTSASTRPVQVKLGAGVKAKAIAVGNSFAMALTTTGHVLAWGQNQLGTLGIGSTANHHLPVRVKLPAGVTAEAIAAGDQHGLAVTTAGVFAWGSNNFGQLGLGDMTRRLRPARVTLPPALRSAGKITALSAGFDQTLALTSKGLLLAWGGNDSGELGDDSTVGSDVAVKVRLPAGTKVTSVSAGNDSSYALTAAGRVLAWGNGGSGGLGNGQTQNSLVPVHVSLAAGLKATGIGAGPETGNGFAIVIR